MKKIKNGWLLLSMMPAIALVNPIVNSIKNTNSIEIVNNFDGFDLTTPQRDLFDNQIEFGAYKQVKNFTDILTLEESQQNTLRNSKKPKVYFHNENFTFYFEETNQSTIVTSSLKSESPEDWNETTLPFSNNTKVVSTHFQDNTLWMIVNQGTITTPSYSLAAFQVLDPESGVPNISLIDEVIPLSFDLTGENTNKVPTIVPVHSQTNNGKLEKREEQILVMLQNEGILQLTNNGTNNLKKVTIIENVPTIENISIANFENQVGFEQAQVLSMFVIDKNPLGSQNTNLTLGVYHSKVENENQLISFSTFENGQYVNTIYDLIVQNYAQFNLEATMPYPKIVSYENGYEIFWIFNKAIANGGSYIFSTKLNSDFQALPIDQQPEVINTNQGFENFGDIVFIDYRENGNFEQGSVYIPVEFQKNVEGQLVRYPGIINWKETNNNQYWNQTEPFFIIENFENGNVQTEKPTMINSQFLEKIAINENNQTELTYFFNNVDPNINDQNLWRIFYKQTYIIDEQQDRQLKLSYDTQLPTTIITNTLYSPQTTNEDDIIDEIKNYSKDLVKASDITKQPIQAVANSLEFSNELGINTANIEVQFTEGYYQNGDYISIDSTNNPVYEIELIEQPIGEFFPLDIILNETKPNIFTSSNGFANQVVDLLPSNGAIDDSLRNELIQKNIIGQIDSGAFIEISNLYLDYLSSIVAVTDEFNGTAQFEFGFTNSQNATQSRALTVTGFQATSITISIIIPIIFLVFVITLATIIFILTNRKKKAMLFSIQKGMELNDKMNVDNDVSKQLETIEASKKESLQKNQTRPIVGATKPMNNNQNRSMNNNQNRPMNNMNRPMNNNQNRSINNMTRPMNNNQNRPMNNMTRPMNNNQNRSMNNSLKNRTPTNKLN